MSDGAKTKLSTYVWAISALLLAAAIVIGTLLRVSRPRPRAWAPSDTVSADQIRRIAAAIGQFADSNGHRPMRLEQLVQTGVLKAEHLFDTRRTHIPRIDPNTGRFEINPDVLFFPAVDPNDPGGLVLLCTLLVHNRGDPYHVIYNDGRYEALNNRQLIQALNRTYTHVARATWGEPPTDANSASGS